MRNKMKTFSEYAIEVERTRVRKDSTHTPEQHLVGHALGVAGEAGEVADLIKKWTLHGHPRDHAKLMKELGDVLWYVVAIGADCGISLGEIAQTNVDKLRARYPNGFTQADSIERRDVRAKRSRGAGERNGNAVLTDKQREAAIVMRAEGRTFVEIGAQLGVSESAIRRLAHAPKTEA